VPRRPRLAAIKIALDGLKVQCQPRRATVDHATDGGAMRFAERTDPKQGADAVACHVESLMKKLQMLAPDGLALAVTQLPVGAIMTVRFGRSIIRVFARNRLLAWIRRIIV